MYDDSRKLMAAVSKATGHGLDADDPDDRLTMQNGCYILNSWGFGPMYRFSLYIRARIPASWRMITALSGTGWAGLPMFLTR